MSSPTSIHEAIFGGSFDPIHLGHLAMAEQAITRCRLDRLHFMPAAVSPFKSGTTASAAQRLRMIQFSLLDHPLPAAEVSNFELQRPGPSYSWETVAHFTALRPETIWHWILGTDQWNQIHSWAEPERLRQSLHFIVFSRDGETVQPRPGWHHQAITFQHPASSSAIRSNFTQHQSWLTPSVIDFCKSEGLYQS